MAEDTDETALAVQIANAFINLANEKLRTGAGAAVIAAGLRNAAANFTAFAESHGRGAVHVDAFADQFKEMLEYYADVHEKAVKPVTGLERLVEQVKKE